MKRFLIGLAALGLVLAAGVNHAAGDLVQGTTMATTSMGESYLFQLLSPDTLAAATSDNYRLTIPERAWWNNSDGTVSLHAVIYNVGAAVADSVSCQLYVKTRLGDPGASVVAKTNDGWTLNGGEAKVAAYTGAGGSTELEVAVHNKKSTTQTAQVLLRLLLAPF